MKYQGIATIITNEGTQRCESSVWDEAYMAACELRYFITKCLPVGESFKVFQTIKHINDEDL